MLNQRQAFICPCCGGFIGEAAAPVHVSKLLGNGYRRTLFEYMSRHVGEVVERDVLMAAIYGNRKDGGAMTAGEIVVNEMGRLRRAIEPYGWTIDGASPGRGRKAVYRLIPMEAGA